MCFPCAARGTATPSLEEHCTQSSKWVSWGLSFDSCEPQGFPPEVSTSQATWEVVSYNTQSELLKSFLSNRFLVLLFSLSYNINFLVQFGYHFKKCIAIKRKMHGTHREWPLVGASHSQPLPFSQLLFGSASHPKVTNISLSDCCCLLFLLPFSPEPPR